MSSDDIVPDLEQILEKPHLVGMVVDALSESTSVQDLKAEDPEIIRSIKLEAAWALTNIAYGEEEPQY